MQTEEGRALSSSGNYHYEYTLADHLGNARLTFDTYSGSAVTTQQDDYYAFGLENNRSWSNPKNEYLYNKKELQEELGQYDYGARFYDPVIARWTSVDRLAEKYSSMTPYQYGALNPIRNVDVNGDSVKVNYNNQNILYQNGKLYNKDGSQYKGAGTKLNKDGSVKRYTGFLGDAVGNLNSLGKSKAGSAELNALEGSKNVFTIKDAAVYNNGKNEFKADNVRAAYAAALQAQGNQYSIAGGSGGTVFFNPNDSNFGTLQELGGGTGFHPKTNLGHELFHTWDADRGLMNDDPVNGLETSEWRASYYENQIRNQLGYPYRSEYGTKAGPVSILDVNGNPVNQTAPAPHP